MLKVKNYAYRHLFSQTQALDDVSFEIASGEALLLTGRSGSGKSTLLAALAGLIPHYYKGEAKGSVEVDGFEPKDVPLSKIGAHVGLMLQNAEVQFLAPTVAEEIYLSLKCHNLDAAKCRELTEVQLQKFKLGHIRNASVFDLSEGQKQKVVLAALTALKPKVLLLDEPTANLDPLSIAELKAILQQLKQDGLALLIADHRLGWLNGLCEKIVVLQQGRIGWQGDFAALLENKQYAELGLRIPEEQHEREIEVLKACADGVSATNLAFGYSADKPVFTDYNCAIPYGSVTVLNGPSGIGKTTLGKVLAGLKRPLAGNVSFGGGMAVEPAELAGHSKVVLQNSDHQLYMNSALAELCLAISMCPRSARDEALQALQNFGLAELQARHPQSLSGGEKQRLAVAAGVAVLSRLVILDEPTSGLDGQNLRLMAEHIRRLAEQGSAVLVITHDVELINMCADYKINCPLAA